MGTTIKCAGLAYLAVLAVAEPVEVLIDGVDHPKKRNERDDGAGQEKKTQNEEYGTPRAGAKVVADAPPCVGEEHGECDDGDKQADAESEDGKDPAACATG